VSSHPISSGFHQRANILWALGALLWMMVLLERPAVALFALLACPSSLSHFILNAKRENASTEVAPREPVERRAESRAYYTIAKTDSHTKFRWPRRETVQTWNLSDESCSIVRYFAVPLPKCNISLQLMMTSI
jgi:hypothetical protein